MNLSPWFYPSDPPVRQGMYQLKSWVGQITEAEWDGAYFRIGDMRIDPTTIRGWRGVVKP